jgi:hypothetical protein
MKKRNLSVCIGITLGSISFLAPLDSDAAFYLYLKNGGRISTASYRQENDMIYFKYSEGEASVAKKDVERIETTDQTNSKHSSLIHHPTVNSDQIDAPATKSTDTTSTKNDEITTPAKSKDDPYVREFADLQGRFGESQRMTRKDLYQLSEDLVRFRNKLLKDRVGHIYVKEMSQTVEMGNQVEDIIKARNY